jgi:hypothetical protein
MYHTFCVFFNRRIYKNGILTYLRIRYLQLWPENPAYQVYVPGYHHHSMLSPQPNLQQSLYSLNQSTSMLHQQQMPNRARSVSPGGHPGGGDVSSYDPQPNFQRAVTSGGGGGALYNELQFPAASNYGSMKKRSQRSQRNSNTSTANTGSTTILSSAGEPSPDANGVDSSHLASGTSVENVHHRYVPDFVAVGGRKTAV